MKLESIIVGLFIAPKKGEPMESVEQVKAIAGAGLEGDRYCTGQGSYNPGKVGKRQVTFLNGLFLEDSGFVPEETRRNIVVQDVELMWLIGRDFSIGEVVFRGVKYCDPCSRPSSLLGRSESFKRAFFDRGGLIADILTTGVIAVGDTVVTPTKDYE